MRKISSAAVREQVFLKGPKGVSTMMKVGLNHGG